MTEPLELARRYYDALKRIASYETAERLLKHGERAYGLPGEEVLEMSYENMHAEARAAIKGKKRP